MTSDGDHHPLPGKAGPSQARPILEQTFDVDWLYALRAAVSAPAAEAGLAPGRADDLVIAVHELAANAIRHGAGHGRLRLWQTGQALLCEIADDGPQPPNAPNQWRAEPGHGLSLVRQVADQTSLRSDNAGTLATISFALAAPGPPFRLDENQMDHCTVLTVTGPLDLASAEHLTDAVARLLAKAPAQNLVLDLAGLHSWDSAGLAALVTAQQRISANPDARMVLAGLPGHLAKHLHEAGLADRFTLADSTAAAVAGLT